MRLLCILALATACAPSKSTPADLAMPLASPDLAVDKAAGCATEFGSALTAPYGRLDGTVRAIVPPGDPNCGITNGGHLTLQVTSGGAVYRMVVNVQSDQGPDLRVFYGQKSAPLAGPPWADGWHTDAALDYVLTLGATRSELTQMDVAPLTAAVTNAIPLDVPVSVFASTTGGNSAHLVHRNTTNQDGAIVLDPTSPSPTYLLFAFLNTDF
jgi:hypothetical protein